MNTYRKPLNAETLLGNRPVALPQFGIEVQPAPPASADAHPTDDFFCACGREIEPHEIVCRECL